MEKISLESETKLYHADKAQDRVSCPKGPPSPSVLRPQGTVSLHRKGTGNQGSPAKDAEEGRAGEGQQAVKQLG